MDQAFFDALYDMDDSSFRDALAQPALHGAGERKAPAAEMQR